jgi:hypothetical protein
MLRSLARSCWSAPTMSAFELVGRHHPGGDGVAPRGQQHPQRLVVAAAAWQRQMLQGECLPSGADRIDRSWRRCAGPAAWDGRLHDLLAVGEQERGQSGAGAASALDRPGTPARDLGQGEAEKLPIAAGGRAGGDLGADPTDWRDGRSGQGIAVGADPDDAVNGVCKDGHAVVLPSGGGRGRCRPGRSHRAAER